MHPSYRFLGEDDTGELRDGLDPVYPAIEGIGPQTLGKFVDIALRRLPPAADLELLPADLLAGLDLPTLREALLAAHRPPVGTPLAELSSGTHPAIRRLALEEMLAHHLSLRRQRIALRAHGALPVPADAVLAERLRGALPYSLTGAQQRVSALADDVDATVRTCTELGGTLWAAARPSSPRWRRCRRSRQAARRR